MKGHVRRRGLKSWAVLIYEGRDNDGKKKYSWTSVKGTRKDADAVCRKLITAMETGVSLRDRRTVGQWLDQWVLENAKLRVSAKTLERYQSIITTGLKPQLENIRLRDLKPAHIQAAYTKWLKPVKEGGFGLSEQTVVHYHRLLHRALGQAVRFGLVMQNVAVNVDPPKVRRYVAKTLSTQQAASVLEQMASSPLYLPTVLALGTGMRRGEILALRWSDVDLGARRIHVRRSVEQTGSWKEPSLAFKSPKSGKTRTLSISTDVVQALSRHQSAQKSLRAAFGPEWNTEQLVVCTPEGATWRPDSLSDQFRDFLAYRRLPKIRFHDLRHTHATWLLEANVPPKVVSDRLGHSTITLTADRYQHSTPSTDALAVAAIEGRICKPMGKTRRRSTPPTRKAS